MQEYLPAKMITTLSEDRKEKLKKMSPGSRAGISLEAKNLLADDYLKFLVTELKPFIDKEYRTRTGRDDTFIMGSSGGAMISIYAITEYPDVFGGAGGVSTHWPFADGLLVEYTKAHLPDPATHKIYFDFGTETLDKGYEPYQNKMDEAMKAKGYVAGKNWLTRKYPGDDHSERSWRKRVHVPLEFFFGK
jgi:predicted alpha/beta superfamily hydrolase